MTLTIQPRRDCLVSLMILAACLAWDLNSVEPSYSALHVNLNLISIVCGMKSGEYTRCLYLQAECRTSIGLESKTDTKSEVGVTNSLGNNASRLEMGSSLFIVFKLAWYGLEALFELMWEELTNQHSFHEEHQLIDSLIWSAVFTC